MEKLPPRELVSSKNEYNNAIFTVFHFRSLFRLCTTSSCMLFCLYLWPREINLFMKQQS